VLASLPNHSEAHARVDRGGAAGGAIARASCVAAFSPAERAALHGALDDPDRTNVPARRLAFRQARPNDIHVKI
jgi:hypothetical protein